MGEPSIALLRIAGGRDKRLLESRTGAFEIGAAWALLDSTRTAAGRRRAVSATRIRLVWFFIFLNL
jgi:hypothetical protein